MVAGFHLNSVTMAYKKRHAIFMRPSMRSYVMSCFIGALCSVFLFTYLYYSGHGVFPAISDAFGMITAAFAGMAWGAAITLSNRKLDTILPWHSTFNLRFIAGYGADLLVTTAMAILLRAFSLALIPNRSLTVNNGLIIKTAIVSALTLFVYRIIYALMYSYNQYSIAQIETVKNERRQLELQFQALKTQISPHYLFNSLNTISSLMIKDVASAEQFIRRLAQTYQYVLDNQDKTCVLLEDEIDFVKSYYYLLRIRFQQQIEVEINVPATILKSRIPPLTLQMLVENAVKHNAMRSDKKLFIYITAQDNTYLRVINTKATPENVIESFNVGLDNIRKRYQFFTNDLVVVNDDEKFSVALPVLNAVSGNQKFSA